MPDSSDPDQFLNEDALALDAWSETPLILARAWHKFRRRCRYGPVKGR